MDPLINELTSGLSLCYLIQFCIYSKKRKRGFQENRLAVFAVFASNARRVKPTGELGELWDGERLEAQRSEASDERATPCFCVHRHIMRRAPAQFASISPNQLTPRCNGHLGLSTPCTMAPYIPDLRQSSSPLLRVSKQGMLRSLAYIFLILHYSSLLALTNKGDYTRTLDG